MTGNHLILMGWKKMNRFEFIGVLGALCLSPLAILTPRKRPMDRFINFVTHDGKCYTLTEDAVKEIKPPEKHPMIQVREVETKSIWGFKHGKMVDETNLNTEILLTSRKKQ